MVGSVRCRCGHTFVATTRNFTYPGAVRFATSGDIVIAILRDIMGHMPLFLVGHNCHAYDNVVLLTHLVNEMHDDSDVRFDTFFTDASGYTDFGYERRRMITIPGVNNVDTLVWFRQTMGAKYASFSLDNLAKQEGIDSKIRGAKFNMDGTDQDFHEPIIYNVQDCQIVLHLCEIKAVGDNIITLCIEAGSPFRDVAFYRTGAVGSCAMGKYCRETLGAQYVWNGCTTPIKVIRGGCDLSRGLRVLQCRGIELPVNVSQHNMLYRCLPRELHHLRSVLSTG